MVLIWFGVVWWWFGANMAGQRNKMLLNFFFNYWYYNKYILGVKKVVWDGLEVVWGVSMDLFDLKMGYWSQCTEYSVVYRIQCGQYFQYQLDLSGSVDGVLDWGSNGC